MKLLIITQTVDSEDANLGFFHGWINEFAKSAESVKVICNSAGADALPENVKIYSMGKERGLGRLRRYLNFYRYLFGALPESDAVFVHMIPAWVILAWPLAVVFRKKIYLWYTHGSVPLSLKAAEKLVTKIFTASKESCRLKSAKVVAVGHGIDAGVFRRSKEVLPGGLRFISVSRISPSKDMKTLILGVGELKRRGFKNASFDIVGAPILSKDSGYVQELHDLVRKEGLGDVVKFMGARTPKELPEVYHSHNIFLHASRTGSVDKAVLEAMAAGLQVLTSSDAYSDFVAGVTLYKQGDYKDLASKVVDKGWESGVVYNARGVGLVAERAALPRIIAVIVEQMRS